LRILTTAAALILSVASAAAQDAASTTAETDLCRATGLIALQQQNPAVLDLTLDLDGMTVAKANAKVGETQIRTVVIGDAYMEKGNREKRHTFLCLIGNKGKVLLTFFTEK
jgi:hypothetical protein